MPVTVHVRLTGRLAEHLSGGTGEADLDIAGDSLADLIETVGLATDEHLLTAVNDTVVAPVERAGYRLADGDRVTVMPPVKGG